MLRLALLTWLMCLVFAPALAQNASLYTGEAPVADQSDEARAAGMKSALTQVVVKLTGDNNVLTRDTVAKALSESERYAQQYSYRQDVVNDASGAQVKLTLVAQFDRAAIDRLLHDFGIRTASGARPPVLTFVALDDGNGMRLVSESSSAEGRSLVGAAQQRGLNIALPNLSDADQNALGAQAAWNNDVAGLAPFAAKYQTNLLLVGQIRRVGDQWSAHWTLSDGTTPQSWDSTGGPIEVVLNAGAAGAADRLSGHYAATSLERKITSATVWISGLGSAEDYARMLSALTHDELVREALPQSVRGDGVLVKLTLNVALEPWLANLPAEGPLRVVSARPPLEGVEATLAFAH
jgi:hypothetical protein